MALPSPVCFVTWWHLWFGFLQRYQGFHNVGACPSSEDIQDFHKLDWPLAQQLDFMHLCRYGGEVDHRVCIGRYTASKHLGTLLAQKGFCFIKGSLQKVRTAGWKGDWWMTRGEQGFTRWWNDPATTAISGREGVDPQGGRHFILGV